MIKSWTGEDVIMAVHDETNAAAASSSEGHRYTTTTTDTGRSAAVAATAADGGNHGAGRAAVAPVKKQNLMSKREIRWHLNRKPWALRRSNPDLTPPSPGEEVVDEDKERLYRMAKMFYESEKRQLKMREWVRGEMETKGYVEMDDDLVRRRAEVQAAVVEEWKKIEALLESETEGEDDEDDSSDEYSSDEDDQDESSDDYSSDEEGSRSN